MLRISLAVLAVLTLGTQASWARTPWPCGNTYFGMQCSCLYWHEWFSHKPCCCDPCNFCGEYTQSRNPYVVTGPRYTRFGEVYSDGSGSSRPGAIGNLYDSPNSRLEPTPAAPEGVMEDAGPVEALPGPTTSLPRARTAGRYPQVASPPAGHTLGGQMPRTRLFTR